MSPVVIELALSPTVLPGKVHFLLLDFRVIGEDSAAFMGYMGDFQSKGLKCQR